MGFVFGGLMTTYERTTPVMALPGQPEPPKVPLKEAVRVGFDVH